jgi:hypothetical protein
VGFDHPGPLGEPAHGDVPAPAARPGNGELRKAVRRQDGLFRRRDAPGAQVGDEPWKSGEDLVQGKAVADHAGRGDEDLVFWDRQP